MSAEISFFHLVMEASLLVQFVMLILLIFSIMCWAMIFQRRKILKTAALELKAFEDKFWSGADLSKLYSEISAKPQVQGIETLFIAGFKEFARLRKSHIDNPQIIVDGTHRIKIISSS